MPKQGYKCAVCGTTAYRWPSQVRNPKAFTCCMQCKAMRFQTSLLGKANPNYRHGRHTASNICRCGNRKDYRSKQCARCARRGYTRRDATALAIPIELLTRVTAESHSYVEMGRRLSISRQSARRLVKANNLEDSHFSASGRAKRFSPPEVILVENSKASHALVRACILRNHLLDYVCSCGQPPTWNGKPLTLQLHHKNGDPTDNRLENLEFLCPNCHTQTKTYTGRNSMRKEQSSVEVANA